MIARMTATHDERQGRRHRTSTTRTSYLEQVRREIDEEVRRRRAAGEFPPSFERKLEELFARFTPTGTHDDRFTEALKLADRSAYFDTQVPFGSRREPKGFTKWVLWQAEAWFVNYVVRQLNHFSSSVMRVVHLLDETVERGGARSRDAGRAGPAGRGGDLAGADPAPFFRAAEHEAVGSGGAGGRILHAECGDGSLIEALTRGGPRRLRDRPRDRRRGRSGREGPGRQARRGARASGVDRGRPAGGSRPVGLRGPDVGVGAPATASAGGDEGGAGRDGGVRADLACARGGSGRAGRCGPGARAPWHPETWAYLSTTRVHRRLELRGALPEPGWDVPGEDPTSGRAQRRARAPGASRLRARVVLRCRHQAAPDQSRESLPDRWESTARQDRQSVNGVTALVAGVDSQAAR